MFNKLKKMISCLMILIFSMLLPHGNVFVAADTDNGVIVSGRTYTITSKNSGKVMEVANLGTQNGDRIQQWDYANGTSQQWIIEKVEGKYYKIISKNSNKVIDVKDLYTANGAVIHQWDYVGGDNQLWYFEKTNDGYYKIKSKQSNKCIDVSGISKNNGASMQLWEDVNDDNQLWDIKEITDDLAMNASCTYKFVNKSSNKVIQVSNASSDNGSLVEQWEENNTTNQNWKIEKVSDRYFKIINKASGKVLDIKDIAEYNGAMVQIWEDVNGDNQLWYFEKTNDGFYKIKSKKSNKCLDVVGISNNNGAKLQIWNDVNGDNQKWQIKQVDKLLGGFNLITEDKPEDDTDGDGLTNEEEEKYGTNSKSIDTDDDSLTDYEEIFVFHTDPLKKDTDGDGVSDGAEVRLNLDPLVANKKEDAYSLNIDNDALEVSMNVHGSAEGVSSSYVTKSDNDYYDSIPGKIGNVLDFHTDDKIDYAEVTIKYDINEVNKKQLSENNLCVYYINEDELSLEKIDSVVDKNNKTVTAKLNHFSPYIICDSSKVINNLNDIDIIFAIDKSGSMNVNDKDSKRIEVCKQFVSTLNGDNYRYGIVAFDSEAAPTLFDKNPVTYLTSNDKLVQNNLDKLKGIASGGTNIANALNKAVSLFDKDSRKVIILLTDGDGSGNINNAMKNVIKKNVQVYTVGLGNDVNVGLLQDKISFPSLGQYYHVNEADNLINAFKDIGLTLKIPKKATITLRRDYNHEEKVDVRLVADSGFRPYNDGYPFENFSSNYSDGGQCFGFSITSILNYCGKMPKDSSVLNSNLDFEYDLSECNYENTSFYNNNKLPSDIGTEIIEATIPSSKENTKVNLYTDLLTSIDLDEKYKDISEKIKSIVWWQSIQDADLHPSDYDVISELQWRIYRDKITSEINDAINNSPIQISMSNDDGGHAVVGETIYQDINDSSTYYIGIYDCNYPENEEYIVMKRKYYFHNKIFSLDFYPVRNGYKEYERFYSTNIEKILNKLN